MGLTERHWFEEEDTLNERQLENEVEYGERRYQEGYKKGYADALASRSLGTIFILVDIALVMNVIGVYIIRCASKIFKVMNW